jgi:opacity protein-like surface antigen
MNMVRQWPALALALGLGAAPFAAGAAGLADSGRFYIGLTAGVAAVIAEDFDTDKNERGSGRPSAGVFVGLRMVDLPIGKGWPLALELGYQDISSHTIPYRVGGGTTDLTARGSSTYLALKLAAPLSERVALYGRLGTARNKVDGNTPAGQTPIDIDGRRTGVLSAFGAEFQMVPNLNLRAEVTGFGRSSSESRAGGISAGVSFHF